MSRYLDDVLNIDNPYIEKMVLLTECISLSLLDLLEYVVM